jgi:hypothetical protein
VAPDSRAAGDTWTWQAVHQVTVCDQEFSVAICVQGVGEAQVTTAVAVRTEEGPLSLATVGIQVKNRRPRPYHRSHVIDTTLQPPKDTDAG